MSNRKLGYVICVVLLAMVLSVPHVFIGMTLGRDIWRHQGLVPLWGLGAATYGGTNISFSPIWKDKFFYLTMDRFHSDGRIEWGARSSDPETGEATKLDFTLTRPNSSRFSQTSCGDRLFIYAVMGDKEVIEVVDDVLQPTSLTRPPRRGFIWNGELAEIEASQTAFTLSTFKEGACQKAGTIILPEPDPDPSVIAIAAKKGYFQRGLMQGYSRDDRVHLFLNLDGRCYYREGIELKSSSADSNSDDSRKNPNEAASKESTLSPNAAVSDVGLAGWTLVRSTDVPIQWRSLSISSRSFMGMFVERQPAGFVVDELSSGSPIGHVYRFDGTTWTKFASQQFPMGSGEFRTVTTQDGRLSYLIVSTTTGSTYVYAIDANGIRKTRGGTGSPVHALRSLYAIVCYPVGAIVWATLLGIGTWALMWWWTKPDYEFGVQTVKLASLGWRATARLIDMTFIGMTAIGLGWLMMRDFDWLTPLEAFNLKIDHPTIHTVVRVAIILAAWIVMLMVAMIATQAVWGVTPGKWLCRLRTMRTSLRPCGFARSLARELVFFVDSGDLFFWTPGIVSIALTDKRQRLGDLVADTIVVESRTLAS